MLRGVLEYRLAENKLAGRFGEIGKQDQAGDQEKVAMFEHQLKSTGRSDRCLGDLASGLVTVPFAKMDPVRKDHAQPEQRRRNKHHGVSADGFEQPSRYFRAEYRAE